MPSFYERIRTYKALLSRWSKMLLGRSYWHTPQEMGQRFEPGRLAGYFNDLTAKTRWTGPINGQGLPLSHGSRQDPVVFPTVVLQKALGHWDVWLITDHEQERQRFLTLAEWAIQAQDEQGGWPLWGLLGLHFSSAYSAMTQGEGISVMTRAFSVTGNEKFLEAARVAYECMVLPISKGGTSRYLGEDFVLEEYPTGEIRTVLNGWIFALFGLYDYHLVVGAEDTRNVLDLALETLIRHLDRYDAGFWSYYDCSGKLASPFYHDLHCAQFAALELAFPHRRDKFVTIRHRFEHYRRSRWKHLRAITIKAYQKLLTPSDLVSS